MISMISSSCESTGEEPDAGNHDPRLGTFDGCFKVLGQAAIASEPGKRPFDHPASGLRLEGADALGSGDDLDRPRAELSNGIEQFVAAIDAVGEDVPQLRERAADRFEQRHGTMVVLDVAGVYEHSEQRAAGVGDDVTLASHHPLGGIKPARPPLSVVFTLWLSIMPAEG